MSPSNALQSSQMPPNRSLSSDSIADKAAVVSQAIAVHCEDRWQVYHRLQELEIDCQCQSFQPLQAHIKTPTEAVQLWSIVQRISEPRSVQLNRLKQSWLKPCAKRPRKLR